MGIQIQANVMHGENQWGVNSEIVNEENETFYEIQIRPQRGLQLTCLVNKYANGNGLVLVLPFYKRTILVGDPGDVEYLFEQMQEYNINQIDSKNIAVSIARLNNKIEGF